MSLQVFISDEQSEQPVHQTLWQELAELVWTDIGHGKDGEVSIRFLNETEIAWLNEEFLGHEGTTDVLSFPVEDAETFSSSTVSDTPILLGDIAICPAVAARNAVEHDVAFSEELALLVVHGMLHLTGSDHEDDDEAEEMERHERELLSHFWQLHSAPSQDTPSPNSTVVPTEDGT